MNLFLKCQVFFVWLIFIASNINLMIPGYGLHATEHFYYRNLALSLEQVVSNVSPTKLRSHERKIKVACLGNSVTFGEGVYDRYSNSYPAVLQSMLGPDYSVRNFGVNGATLLKNGFKPYFQTDEFAAALEFCPEIVVIHLGLNDTDPRAWPYFKDEFINDYLWIIDTLRIIGVSQFYIARLSPIFNGHKRFKAGTRDWYWQIQERIEEVARLSGSILIDFYEPLKNRPELLPDNLHPDAEGTRMLANTVFQAITGEYGRLKLPQVWKDNMVLQRDRVLRLSGTTCRNEPVNVAIAGRIYHARASGKGEWELLLGPLRAGGPYELLVTTPSDTVVIRNILAGEVWLCSGQSNMEWPVSLSLEWERDSVDSADENLRIINFCRWPLAWNQPWDSVTLSEINKLHFFEEGNWLACTPESLGKFSAVAYYFGRKLREELNVPVGLIEMAVGGSPAEAWIERKALELHPQLVDLLYDYRNSEFMEPWVRDVIATNLQLTDNPRQRHPFEPAYLYESGISQLAGYPLKGFIWYQGESNASFPELYEVLLPELVKNWRETWRDSTLPFYFAQISSLNRPSWPEFRETQRRLSKGIPGSGLIVTTDVGHPTDVHPRDKRSVGERFASLALCDTYGLRKTGRSPEPVSARRRGNIVVIKFRPLGRLKTSDGLPIREVEVSLSGNYFRLANARIRYNRLKIDAPEAVTVRYGWRPYSEGNLISKSGLPVSTFRLKIN